MPPDSNHTSKTSGTRRISPPHFLQVKTMSSILCLCKSVIFCPDNCSSSSTDPTTVTLSHLGFGIWDLGFSVWQSQTGKGVPQNRLREIAQSRAPSCHLPKRPSLICSGTQRICLLFFKSC